MKVGGMGDSYPRPDLLPTKGKEEEFIFIVYGCPTGRENIKNFQGEN
jgi:hypothetical protein